MPFIKEFYFGIKARRYLRENYFDIINTHANWGFCLRGYKKKRHQRIIHTYHGVTYYFYKTHLSRFSLLKKILISPALFLSYVIEKPPVKISDKIVCVSLRVKEEIERLYGKRKLEVLRTGVDLREFKRYSKILSRKRAGLKEDDFIGLYVGRGGWFRKGLDRAVKISEEFYKKNKKYRLLVIGPDKEKVRDFLNKPFIILS